MSPANSLALVSKGVPLMLMIAPFVISVSQNRDLPAFPQKWCQLIYAPVQHSYDIRIFLLPRFRSQLPNAGADQLGAISILRRHLLQRRGSFSSLLVLIIDGALIFPNKLPL